MQGWSRAFRRKREGTFVHYACSTALEVKRIPLRLRCLRTKTRSAMPVVASGEGQQVRGVIARSKDAPVELVTIVVPDPGPGEAVVKVLACGVCHTDLHYRQGGIGNDYPYLLGHEAAGIVESVGSSVHGLAAGECTKVDPAARPAVAGLLGCGVMAGLGAALNTGNVSRGDSVAVIGCGGVGSAAIAGARLAGAAKIIAIDIDDRKLAVARSLGATDTVNSRDTDAVEAIHRLTGGFGADVAIDAVGHPETYAQAFYGRDLAGTVVLVGVPTPEMRLELPLLDVFGRGGSLKSSWYGDCLPDRDFPMLIDLYLQGRLPLDAFVSEEIAIGEIETAFDKMNRGDVLRSVVIMENADRTGTRA